jgi:AraC family transcriptional regulator of adaptative response/methylated-DNA-[protein]-cysteine methyltransferase
MRGMTDRTSALPAGAAFATDAARWAAVVARDGDADGAFWYAVRSTGIYCRPTCRSRLPRRENVEFFAAREAAERAGFRPCKRCRPGGEGTTARHARLVARACRAMDRAADGAGRPPTLAALAAEVGMSPHHFQRTFRAVTGVTPRQYLAARRRERLQRELATAAAVTDAIHGAGYASGSSVYGASGALLGMRPGDYARGGEGERIRFAAVPCSLGWLGIGATARGVAMIAFDDDPARLRTAAAARFPRAEIVDGDAEFARWIDRVVTLVEHPADGADLPLDVRGTAFQCRVWEALRAIPPGATTTYAALAKAVGRPAAARAVAGACAANGLAVAVPCHRALRADGGLAGYRWGVERKRALLERERDPSSGA